MKTNILLTLALFVACCVISCQHRQLECTCKYKEGERVAHIDVMQNTHELVIGSALYNIKYKGCEYLMEGDTHCLLYAEYGLTPIQ